MAGKEPDSNNLADYIGRTAQGPLVNKPKHIFLILSESYANWPLLDKYKKLHNPLHAIGYMKLLVFIQLAPAG